MISFYCMSFQTCKFSDSIKNKCQKQKNQLISSYKIAIQPDKCILSYQDGSTEINVSPHAKREAQVILVNLSARAKRETHEILLNLASRAKQLHES